MICRIRKIETSKQTILLGDVNNNDRRRENDNVIENFEEKMVNDNTP